MANFPTYIVNFLGKGSNCLLFVLEKLLCHDFYLFGSLYNESNSAWFQQVRGRYY